MRPFKDMVDEAALEISTKGRETIEFETAMKWAARAMACYIAFRSTGEARTLLDAEDYRHEAIEHGAMVGSSTLEQVHGLLDTARSACIAKVRTS